MTIQIPWNKKYTCEGFIFKFVPRVYYCIDKDGNTWTEKNQNAKIKIILKKG